MASNPYVNKVQLADGTTVIDISDTTATASDVASGKYFYLANGTKTAGTGTGGGGGSVTQDQDGYIVLPSTGGGSSPVLITKSITANGTYDAEDDDADGYSSVTVNVSGGSAQTATGTFTGSGGITQSISASFAPDLIYVFGDLSGTPSLRGIVTLIIIKDTALYVMSDGSSSSSQQFLWKMATNITDYNESNQSGDPYASYSSGTLSFNMAENTSSARFNSSITYNYKLIKWT